MTIRSERLEKRIQELQQFVNDKIERDQIFEAVSKELVRIADTLKQGKLTVQIVSYNQVSAQKLQIFLHKYDDLEDTYRFAPILRICDLNSANGTYVNSQQLQKYQTLRSGDRITLGYEQQNEGSTELLSDSFNEFYQQLAECNILCLVIAPNQMHKLDQMQLIQKLGKTHVSTLVVVVDVPEVINETDLQVNSIKDKIRAWLQGRNDNVQKIEVYSNCESELEIFCHSLRTLTKRKSEDILIKQFSAQLLTELILVETYLIKQVRELEAIHQQDQANLQIVGGDRFRRQFDEAIRLINYDKVSIIRKIKSSVNQSVTDLLDELFCDSIIPQLHNYVDALEPEIINKKEGEIYIRLVKKTKKVNKHYIQNPGEFYNNCIKASSKISSQKKQNIFILTTNALLSSNFWQFLLNKLIKSKYKIILVREDSIDANTTITEYYHHTLKKWAYKEWQNVCNIYAEGGLRRFLQTTYETFKLIPCLNLEKSLWEPSQYIDISHIFARSIEKPNCKTSYRKTSLLSFIFGRLRNNLMPFLTISFSLSILGIASRRQIAQWFFQPVFSAFKYAPYPTAFILIFVIYLLLKPLFQNYYKHNLAEMKKAERKLKDETFQSYLKFVQHLTDKIRQEILSSIEAKEEWLDENIQAYRQLLDQTDQAAGSKQPLLKKRIEQQKEHLKSLNQELGELQKLKRRNLN
jgi:hypothetical protein